MEHIWHKTLGLRSVVAWSCWHHLARKTMKRAATTILRSQKQHTQCKNLWIMSSHLFCYFHWTIHFSLFESEMLSKFSFHFGMQEYVFSEFISNQLDSLNCKKYFESSKTIQYQIIFWNQKWALIVWIRSRPTSKSNWLSFSMLNGWYPLWRQFTVICQSAETAAAMLLTNWIAPETHKIVVLLGLHKASILNIFVA